MHASAAINQRDRPLKKGTHAERFLAKRLLAHTRKSGPHIAGRFRSCYSVA